MERLSQGGWHAIFVVWIYLAASKALDFHGLVMRVGLDTYSNHWLRAVIKVDKYWSMQDLAVHIQNT